MPISIEDFRALLVKSGLLDESACRRLSDQFSQDKRGGSQASASAFAKWLVAQGALTRYQASVLLAGRAGPFFCDGYKLTDRIKRGPLAGTYRAVHVGTNHPVGLKFLSGSAVDNSQALAQAVQQVSLAVELRDPHLQRCYHFFQSASYKFIVFEDLKGQTLEEKLNASGALAPAQACGIARRVALALAHVHGSGQVHAEVRPANIWLDETGSAKLLQFPLARDPSAPLGWKSPAELAAPATNGTWADYLAPELAAGGKMPEVSGDIYSLGCTLFQMLCGHVPYPGGDVATKMSRHAKRPMPDIRQQGVAVPRAIAKLVAYTMAKQPLERYHGAAALVQALETYIDPSELAELPDPLTPSSQAYEAWLRDTQSPLITPAAPGVATAATTPGPSGLPVAVVVPDASNVPGADPAVAGNSMAGEVSIEVETSDDRRSMSRRRRFPVALSVMGISAAILITLVVATLDLGVEGDTQLAGARTEANDTQTPKPSVPVTNTENDPSKPPPAANPIENETDPVPNNGAMWESPTAGEPLDLRYLPPASGIVIAWRPAELLGSEEGRRVLSVLGPLEKLLGVEALRNSGVSMENILQAVVAFSPGQTSEELNTSLVLRMREPIQEAELLAAWQNPTPETVAGVPIFTTAQRAFFLPAQGQGQILVIAPKDRVSEAIEHSASPAALRRELEVLARWSDRERTFSMLFAPSFFSTARDELLDEDTVGLEEQLAWLLGDDVRGALFSFHLDRQNLFVELKIAGSAIGSPPLFLRELRERVSGLASRAQSNIGSIPPTAAGYGVLQRFPKMLQFFDKYTRGEIDQRDILLRAYLPGVAAHNLMLGTRLALKPNTLGATAQTPKTMSIEERLAQKVSLSFQRNTLEKAIELLAEELGLDIEISGGDLQLEGITKNQSFGINAENTAGTKILTQMLALSSPEGKLVYVIRNKPNSPDQMVYVTTRAAAAKRGDQLPPALEMNDLEKQ